MSSLQWFDAIAKTAAEIPGVKHAHGAGTAQLAAGPSGRTVEPMVDQLDELPSVFLGHAGADIPASTWSRQTHEVLMTIYLERTPIGVRYADAIAFIDTVVSTFEAHAKAWNADSNGWLQSVVITRFDGIQAAQFPALSNRFFLALPWRLEVKVNRPASYQPA